MGALPEGTEEQEEELEANRAREIYFFDVSAMRAGYGVAPSRTVTLQASFWPRRPVKLALGSPPRDEDGTDPAKQLMAVRFEAELGVQLYSVALRLPAGVRA